MLAIATSIESEKMNRKFQIDFSPISFPLSAQHVSLFILPNVAHHIAHCAAQPLHTPALMLAALLNHCYCWWMCCNYAAVHSCVWLHTLLALLTAIRLHWMNNSATHSTVQLLIDWPICKNHCSSPLKSTTQHNSHATVEQVDNSQV